MITYLSPQDILLIISKTKNPRDHLLLSFLWETGCRVSETLAVTPADVHPDQNVVVIHHLKSQRRNQNGVPLPVAPVENFRSVLITPDMTDAMAKFIKAVRCPKNATVFKIGRRQADEVVKQAAAAAGFRGKCILLLEHNKPHYVSAHRFRDAIAVAKMNYNADAVGQKLLQQQLGHKRFETTSKYIKLGLEDQRKNDAGFWAQQNGTGPKQGNTGNKNLKEV